jgi:hypothetical protein
MGMEWLTDPWSWRSPCEGHAVTGLIFQWDELKAQGNQARHAVSFYEAKTVFNDPLGITISDPDHSEEEERWLEIGFSCKGRLLVVWYAEWGDWIRIIGSRRATAAEQRRYASERATQGA